MQADFDNLPILPLSIGRILGKSFRALGSLFLPFLVMHAVVEVVAALPLLGSDISVYDLLTSVESANGPGLVSALLSVILGLVVSVVEVVLVHAWLQKRPIGLFRAFPAAVPRILTSLLLTAAWCVLVCLGLVLLILPGIYLCIVWAVAFPACVIERRGVFDSLERSYRLVKFQKAKVAAIIVLSMLMAAALMLAFFLVPIAILYFKPEAFTMPVYLFMNVTSQIAAAYCVIVSVVLYQELKEAREGEPIQLLDIFD